MGSLPQAIDEALGIVRVRAVRVTSEVLAEQSPRVVLLAAIGLEPAFREEGVLSPRASLAGEVAVHGEGCLRLPGLELAGCVVLVVRQNDRGGSGRHGRRAGADLRGGCRMRGALRGRDQ